MANCCSLPTLNEVQALEVFILSSVSVIDLKHRGEGGGRPLLHHAPDNRTTSSLGDTPTTFGSASDRYKMTRLITRADNSLIALNLSVLCFYVLSDRLYNCLSVVSFNLVKSVVFGMTHLSPDNGRRRGTYPALFCKPTFWEPFLFNFPRRIYLIKPKTIQTC